MSPSFLTTTRLLYVITCLHYTSALVVYVSSTNSPLNYTYAPASLTASYSTLGGFPSALVAASLSLVSSSDVDSSNCSILKDISGFVVVYNGKTLPTMYGCNRNDYGNAATLARVVEKHGGVGLVIIAAEKVCLEKIAFWYWLISSTIVVAL